MIPGELRAAGLRFDSPAATSLHFGPGASRLVTLVALAGARAIPAIRAWQTAHAMKHRLGTGDGRAGNARLRRHVATFAICPAIAHGVDAHVASLEVGKLADLVLWDPGVLRDSSAACHQGRSDRLGADGRSERLEPDTFRVWVDGEEIAPQPRRRAAARAALRAVPR